jgi:hypothetical protein
MTPKEKAQELFDKYDFIYTYDGLSIMDEDLTLDDRKQCALIAVDEVIDNIEDDYMHYELDWRQEVKQEINKL